MSPGKAASQAGHAFLDSYLTATQTLTDAYRADGLGTKVVLVAPDETALRATHDAARGLGLPTALIVDSGHIMPPHFDGNPIVTALGLGPLTREQAGHLTERFALMT